MFQYECLSHFFKNFKTKSFIKINIRAIIYCHVPICFIQSGFLGAIQADKIFIIIEIFLIHKLNLKKFKNLHSNTKLEADPYNTVSTGVDDPQAVLEQRFLRDERYPSRMPPAYTNHRPERLMKSDLLQTRRLPNTFKKKDFSFNRSFNESDVYNRRDSDVVGRLKDGDLKQRENVRGRIDKRQTSMSSSDDGVQTTPENTSGEDIESEGIPEGGGVIKLIR